MVVPTATTRRPSAFARLIARAAVRWNLVPLPMQFVVFHFFYSYWLKSAQSDVQGDLGDFNSASANLVQDFRREVQSGGRRGHRSCHGPRRLGVDGLVAIAVGCPVVAVDIRGKGHVSDALDAGKEIRDGSESDAAFPKTAALGDLGLQFRCVVSCGIAG